MFVKTNTPRSRGRWGITITELIALTNSINASEGRVTGDNMTLNQIYRLGYYAAFMGSTIDDCPYKGHKQEKMKRAWVLGYIEGLRTIWGSWN